MMPVTSAQLLGNSAEDIYLSIYMFMIRSCTAFGSLGLCVEMFSACLPGRRTVNKGHCCCLRRPLPPISPPPLLPQNDHSEYFEAYSKVFSNNTPSPVREHYFDQLTAFHFYRTSSSTCVQSTHFFSATKESKTTRK